MKKENVFNAKIEMNSPMNKGDTYGTQAQSS